MSTQKRLITVTEREGINYLRSVVERANCLFHEIHRENDFGNDAIIEFVEKEDVKGICIAVQVKSGSSYCTPTTCSIPADKAHFEYWKGHTLPVIGVVYDPQEAKAYWISITNHLTQNPKAIQSGPYSITFLKGGVNRLDDDSFREIFLPTFLNQPVVLDYQKSVDWANDEDYGKHSMGIGSLFHAYRDNLEIWDIFLDILHNRPASNIHPSLVYFLVLIPGHEDIFWSSRNRLSDEIRTYVAGKISLLNKDDAIKLLSFIDHNGIQRGALGQSVVHIILAMNDGGRLLEDIALDENVDVELRKNAVAILVDSQRKGVALLLSRLLEADDEIRKFTQEIISMFNFRDDSLGYG